MSKTVVKKVLVTSHDCTSTKVNIIPFFTSLNHAGFSKDECALIWDFYVTRSFAVATGMPISLEDYGWEIKKNKTKDESHAPLEKAILDKANLDSNIFVRSTKITDSFNATGLGQTHICIDHPRAVLQLINSAIK